MVAVCFAAIAAAAAGALAWVLVPTKFSAYSTLQVSAYTNPLIERGNFRNDFSTFMKTQATRIKSRDVYLGALKQDQVRNLQMIRQFRDVVSTLTWLEDEIKIDFQDGNELLTLTVSGDDPEELVILANGLTNSYLNIVSGKEAQGKMDRVEKLKRIVNDARDKLETKINERKNLIKVQGVNDPLSLIAKFQSCQARLLEAQREMDRLTYDEQKLKQKIEAYQSVKKVVSEDDIRAGSLGPEINADPEMKAKMDKLSRLSSTFSSIQGIHPPTDSHYRNIVNQITMLKKEIDDYSKQLKAKILEGARAKLEAEHRGNVEVLRAELGPLQTQMKKMSDRVGVLKKETEDLSFWNSKIEILNIDIQQDQTKLGGLLDQLKLFQIEVESEPRVSLCQEAVWQVKDAKKRLIIILLAPLFAAGSVCLGIAYFECRMGKIQSPNEVTNQFGLRVVGTIPPLGIARPRKVCSFFEMDMSSSRDLIESVDCIRTMLLRRQTSDPARLIMVTSAAAGEGKSTFAYNVAVSLAATGKRTLLVDCDFRRPTLHQVFEQTLQPGFCEVLAREVPVEASIRPTTTHPNLSFIPAGQWDREVIQELATPILSEFISQLKEEYDFIIIDSHPLLAATDSLLIAQHVDAVLISLMRNVSRSPWVGNALNRLIALEVPVLGAVLSGIPAEMASA